MNNTTTLNKKITHIIKTIINSILIGVIGVFMLKNFKNLFSDSQFISTIVIIFFTDFVFFRFQKLMFLNNNRETFILILFILFSIIPYLC